MQIKKISIKIALATLCCVIAFSTVEAKNRKKSAATTESSAKTNVLESKIGIEIPKDSTNRKLVSLYNEAVDWLKTPYRRGGMSSKGMDCSGLTGTIYKNVFGITLQRSSNAISKMDVKDITKSELRPGDLVFFSTSRGGKRVNHVGVFLGNRHFIHASCSNGVIISSLDEAYYQRTWVKGGRVDGATEKILLAESVPTT
ncbi:C40 family peptidase [Dysgonomonas macrotermitis]|uniref:Cell wall-associated hydrolase, NlpC family n=1 Tax=Dysgonomonas macrotermitis TaxID=1346286 RepID=A0A1M5F380_9BACT|nr:C40 family peptidase [Dysgonomonas macrotermitis]SHF85818.1 Cell wall-associated hydrolase, NlpC family [Dysgonomonas macrotermitis]